MNKTDLEIKIKSPKNKPYIELYAKSAFFESMFEGNKIMNVNDILYYEYDRTIHDLGYDLEPTDKPQKNNYSFLRRVGLKNGITQRFYGVYPDWLIEDFIKDITDRYESILKQYTHFVYGAEIKLKTITYYKEK